jgi:folate-binding protein YgfZ
MMVAAFGNPLVEQRELLAGKAAVRLDGRGLLQVGGADRHKFLNNTLSQELLGLRAGDSAEALLLDPHGHIEQVLHVVDDGQLVWLITAAGQAEALAVFLERMTFRSDVTIADVSGEYVVFGHFGGALGSTLGDLLALTWVDPWPDVVAGGVRYAERSASDWSYCESVVARSEVARVEGALAPAGELALEALRVAAHRPDQATEVDDRALPHEFDWLSTAVHLKKGCYRGQETVAKVHNLGHPPRRLTLLHLDGSEVELPEHGAAVFEAGSDALRGHITSVGIHYEAGPIALAILARGVPENAALEVACDQAAKGRIAATQEVIVPASAGQVANVEAIRDLTRGKRGKGLIGK